MTQVISTDFCNGLKNFTEFEEKVATFSAIPVVFIVLVFFCLSRLHHLAIFLGWSTSVIYIVLVGYYPVYTDPDVLKDTFYITHILWNFIFITIYFFTIFISDKKNNLSVNNTGFQIVCFCAIIIIAVAEYQFRNHCKNVEWTIIQLLVFIILPLSRFFTLICTTKNVRSQYTEKKNDDGKTEKLLTEVKE